MVFVFVSALFPVFSVLAQENEGGNQGETESDTFAYEEENIRLVSTFELPERFRKDVLSMMSFARGQLPDYIATPIGQYSLVLHFYRSQEEYRDRGYPETNYEMSDSLALTSYETNESYMVPFYPRTDSEWLKEEAPTQRFQRLLMHEMVHQYLVKTTPGYEYAPEWYEEGLAAYYTEKILKQYLEMEDLPSTYRYDFLSHIADELEKGRFVTLKELLLNENTTRNKMGSQNYTCAWLLVRFLKEEAKEDWRSGFSTFESELRSRRSDRIKNYRGYHLFRRMVTASLEDLEKPFFDYVRSIVKRPRLNYWGHWEDLDNGGIRGTAPTDLNAQYVLSEDPIEARSYVFAFEFRLRSTGSGQVNVLFNWLNSANFHEIFVSREGEKVGLYRRSDGEWERVDEQEIEPNRIKTGTWQDMKINVSGERVRVHLDGNQIYEVTLEEDLVLPFGYRGIGLYDSVADFRHISSSSE